MMVQAAAAAQPRTSMSACLSLPGRSSSTCMLDSSWMAWKWLSRERSSAAATAAASALASSLPAALLVPCLGGASPLMMDCNVSKNLSVLQKSRVAVRNDQQHCSQRFAKAT